MKHIALISEHASPRSELGGADGGGQNVYVAQIARYLASQGYLVDIFTRRDNSDLPEITLWADGIHLIHVPAGPPVKIAKEKLLPYMDEFTAFIVKFCGRRPLAYDVIHANFFMSAWVAAGIKKALGIPFVVTFHALGRVRRLHQGSADGFPARRLEIEDHVIHVADRIIAECPQDKADLMTFYHADSRRIRCVPCGFSPNEFRPTDKQAARAAVGVGADEWVILQLGRMVPRKGVDTVIRSLDRLRQHHGIAARLLIVGGESRVPDPRQTPEIGRLMALTKELDVANSVTFVGSRGRSELHNYYNAANVFVTVPTYEPFGITPLEAMACAVPVIGSAVGGIKYTVRDNISGYLVPPNDPSALAERLARLHAQPQLAATMGQRGRDRVCQHFTWRHVGQQLLKVYHEVVSRAEPVMARPVQALARASP